jgi:hypothetical protein
MIGEALFCSPFLSFRLLMILPAPDTEHSQLTRKAEMSAVHR